MTSVISANGCCGFVLKRRHQFEGFGADCKSLGLFNTEKEAIEAILKAPPASAEALASLAREGEDV